MQSSFIAPQSSCRYSAVCLPGEIHLARKLITVVDHAFLTNYTATVVTVSSVQQSDPVMYVCYTVGHHCLFILNVIVCIY